MPQFKIQGIENRNILCPDIIQEKIYEIQMCRNKFLEKYLLTQYANGIKKPRVFDGWNTWAYHMEDLFDNWEIWLKGLVNENV